MSERERPYDVVVFGATGFTGSLVADYLTRHAGPEVAWAIAGRSGTKLAELIGRLSTIEGGRPPRGALEADIADPASIEKMTASTRVLVTTVGPFDEYGAPVVAACVATGTHYADITGEPSFVDRMIAEHDAAAREKGLRIVSCCGFDSIPADLGTFFAVSKLTEADADSATDDLQTSVRGFVRTRAEFSGGTWHSAVKAMGNFRRDQKAKKRAGRRDKRSSTRKVRGEKGKIHRDATLGAWAMPLPTIDPLIVLRSARALDVYGTRFTYGHYLQSGKVSKVVKTVVGGGAVFALAQLPPTRKMLLSVKKPGAGPDAETRAKSLFTLTFVATRGDRTLVTEVAGGDPGYDETSKMLAETALCLAFDELPDAAGVTTPAIAMGHALIERLQAAGIRFAVVED
ncbi:MAG: saccharopine dehydrogenase NADP-binding domain-containing protein [Acidobacteriota bacterium]